MTQSRQSQVSLTDTPYWKVVDSQPSLQLPSSVYGSNTIDCIEIERYPSTANVRGC